MLSWWSLRSVARLHAGKAACFDGLQSEHLSYSHPIVYTVLARLFYLVMLSEYVPEDFKCGMLIPIPKESGAKRALKTYQFRGTTISPIISKVFENCLLTIYKDNLRTSERQFEKRIPVAPMPYTQCDLLSTTSLVMIQLLIYVALILVRCLTKLITMAYS